MNSCFEILGIFSTNDNINKKGDSVFENKISSKRNRCC